MRYEHIEIRDTVFTQEQQDNCNILSIKGDLDGFRSQEFHDNFSTVLEDESTSSVKVDLSDVTYTNSSGLYDLLQAKEKADEKNKKIIIRNPNKGVLRIMGMIGMTDQFEFEPPIEK